MAFLLTPATPFTTPQGLEVPSAYATVSRFAYDKRQGLLNYGVEYYASQAARQAGAEPLILTGLDRSFVLASLTPPTPREGELGGLLYAPLTPAQANAAGGLTLAYQHLATELANLDIAHTSA